MNVGFVVGGKVESIQINHKKLKPGVWYYYVHKGRRYCIWLGKNYDGKEIILSEPLEEIKDNETVRYVRKLENI